HGVLEQPAQVGMVAAARAGRPSPGAAQLAVAQQRSQKGSELVVVDLAGQVLEEAVELVEVAIGLREEGSGIDGLVLAAHALDPVDLHHQLVAEALDASRRLD